MSPKALPRFVDAAISEHHVRVVASASSISLSGTGRVQLFHQAPNCERDLAIARVDESARSAFVHRPIAAAKNQRQCEPQPHARSQRGCDPLARASIPSSRHPVAAGVSYEIDLWGRLRNATQAARADLLATSRPGDGPHHD